jgi:hypothetical protein
MRSWLLALAVAMASGCYGRASPRTCYAKHIRDGKGGPGAYDRCMASYEREEQIRADRRAGLRPSRGEVILGYVALGVTVAGAARELRSPGTVTARGPAANYAVCNDGWTSGCAAYATHSGCCSYHGGLSSEVRYTNRPADWP